MRIKVTFKLQHQEYVLPHYQQQLIKSWLDDMKSSSKNWDGYVFYNFSGFRGKSNAAKKGLTYIPGQIKLIISSPSEQFLDFITDQILTQKNHEIGPLRLVALDVQREYMPELSDVVKYTCISPLVPYRYSPDNQKARELFVPPWQDKFSDLLYASTMKKMEASGAYTKADLEQFFRFQFVPDIDYIHRLKKQGKLFSRIYPVCYDNKVYRTRTYVLPFTLYAAKEVQRYVYTYGLGDFQEQGLGMLAINEVEQP